MCMCILSDRQRVKTLLSLGCNACCVERIPSSRNTWLSTLLQWQTMPSPLHEAVWFFLFSPKWPSPFMLHSHPKERIPFLFRKWPHESYACCKFLSEKKKKKIMHHFSLTVQSPNLSYGSLYFF